MEVATAVVATTVTALQVVEAEVTEEVVAVVMVEAEDMEEVTVMAHPVGAGGVVVAAVEEDGTEGL
jgi:hypothetical protein